MINDASVVIGGGNWGIKEADVLGYKLINDEYYAREIDFANSTAAGTYTDSTGVVRRSPYNLLQQSNTFSNAIWTKAGTPVPTLTAGELGRDGLNNAWRVQWGTTANTSYILQSFTITNHTASIYIKGTAGQQIRFGIGANVAAGNQFNLDGTWQRLTFSATSGTMFFFSTFFVTGTVASDFLIQDAQLVEGTEALPYFPTTNRLNVPRIDYRNADGSLSTTGRLLLEPQRTNSIRNSSMVGAVAGTSGTTPNNWENASMAGLTRTVVGIGTESGLPYIDLRFAGTATSTVVTVWFDTTTQIAATNAQTWTESVYLKIINGSVPGYVLAIREQDSAGSTLTTGTLNITPTSTLQRFTYTRTNVNASTAFVRPALWISLTNGATYDFTIRIAAPQMELGAYATTWIPTTTATVTRNADAASRTGVSSWIGQTEGTLYCEFNIGSDTFDGDLISVNGGSSANGFFVSFRSSKIVQLIVRTSNTNALIFQRVGNYAIGTNKIAVAYKNGDFAISLNGTAAQVNTSTITMPTGISVVELSVPRLYNSPIPIAQAQAIIFPTRLTNSQLQSLTTL